MHDVALNNGLVVCGGRFARSDPLAMAVARGTTAMKADSSLQQGVPGSGRRRRRVQQCPAWEGR
jgi:hypothetical protein